MYYRKKRNTAVIILMIVLLTVVIALTIMFWPLDNESNTTERVEKESKVNELELENKHDDNSNPTNDTDKKSYYLIKNVNEEIKIFFYDTEGTETFLETTGIVYEVLPPADQEALNDGIKAYNKEELFSILQDYES